MGNTYARNTVNNTINVLFQIMITAVQDCSTRLSQQQRIDIVNSRNVNLSNVNFAQFANISQQCLQSSTTQNAISAQVKTEIEQLAKAITDALAIPGGTTESMNVTNLVTNLAVHMQETFMQNCSADIESNQEISIRGSEGIVIRYVNFDQAVDYIRSCTMNSSAVNNVKLELEQLISQTAVAKRQGLLSGLGQLLLILLVIAAAVFVLLSQGSSALLNPMFWMVTLLLVLGGLIINYFLGFIPYRKVSPNDTTAQQAAARSFNNRLLAAFVGFAVVDVAVMAIYHFLFRPSAASSTASK